ncbi:MAG: septum formation family protein [Nocardioides sp.]|nr:septum formation family protein [Nocardioides sp.]MDP3892079.1 septum formation family protein [Nocardioides sp.]
MVPRAGVEGGEPPFGLLGEDQPMRRHTRAAARRLLAGMLGGMLGAVVLVTGCSPGPSTPPADPAPSTTPGTTAPSAAPAPPASPEAGACYRLSYDEAVAPTSDRAPVPCRRRHTAHTFHVGTIDALVDGHLLAVDSQRVQDQIARTCPRRLARFLGANERQLRLSMFRSVWFSPTLEESDLGADWFRCDAVVLARRETLLPLRGGMRDALATAPGRETYGLCATARPGTRAFARAVCSEDSSWRAVDTVELTGKGYPGAGAVRRAGQQPCEDAGRQRAEDRLDFEWGYEWPSRRQWQAGTRYGVCWVPGD